MAQSELTIRRSALRANLRTIADGAGGARTIAVAKANAYGHGLDVVGRWLLEDGAALLGVATLEEALALRPVLPDGCACVLVLGGMLADEAEEAVACGAIIAVQELAAAEALSREAVRQGVSVRVHLKVDTGMSRLGVPWPNAAEAAHRITALPGLVLSGAMTHLASADEADERHARTQLERWRQACARMPADLMLHCLASAGALRFLEWVQNAVRPGLLVYGVDPGPGTTCPALVPALSMHARLVQVQTVPAGESISYGATFTAAHETRVGVVPVGYADGWPRSLSNCGMVVVRGRRAPVLGRVCMDRFMVDLSRLPGVEAGERVTLIGPELGVNEVAERAGTINHEVLARLSHRMHRRYIDD